jgi:hypothetical protein
MKNAYKILVGKPKGKRSLGRPRRRRENNIKMDLRKIELKGLNWFHLAQDTDRWRALVNTAMYLRLKTRTDGGLL